GYKKSSMVSNLIAVPAIIGYQPLFRSHALERRRCIRFADAGQQWANWLSCFLRLPQRIATVQLLANSIQSADSGEHLEVSFGKQRHAQRQIRNRGKRMLSPRTDQRLSGCLLQASHVAQT